MGTQRLAAVAAISHSKHYNNHTQPESTLPESNSYSINVFFVSATLCGVLVAVCAACWRRKPSSDKPEDVTECRGVYTVSADVRLSQIQVEPPGPPPAYETVVEESSHHKECQLLQEVVTDSYHRDGRPDTGLPSYEAAVLLKDTKL